MLLLKKKLYVNNYGNHSRDFTYIKDVNLILYNLLKSKNITRNEILNICSNKPLNIVKLIKSVEQESVKIKVYKERYKADVIKTHGDNKKIKKYKLIKNLLLLKLELKIL